MGGGYSPPTPRLCHPCCTVTEVLRNSLPFTLMIRTGIGEFWKVMEIDNAIFQDLESFGKERIF